MLSYRHEFHAGNAADVFKHIVLGEVAHSFCRKDKPFTFFDTHSGAQIYELTDDYSQKTKEFNAGIAFFLKNFPKNAQDVPPAIKIYADFERNLFQNFACYGGSSLVVNAFARECDEFVLCELHSTEIEVLRQNIRRVKNAVADGDFSLGNSDRLHAHFRDGFEAAVLLPPRPPLPQRTFALIDPSYELVSDFEKVCALAESALKRCRATICVWLPVLNRREGEISTLVSRCRGLCENSVLAAMNFAKDGGEGEFGLRGSQMLILNSPFQIEENLQEDIEFLRKIFQTAQFSIG